MRKASESTSAAMSKIPICQLQTRHAEGRSPISISVSTQTLRMGSSGFSAALTIARMRPSDTGTRCSRSRLISSFGKPEGVRR